MVFSSLAFPHRGLINTTSPSPIKGLLLEEFKMLAASQTQKYAVQQEIILKQRSQGNSQCPDFLLSGGLDRQPSNPKLKSSAFEIRWRIFQ